MPYYNAIKYSIIVERSIYAALVTTGAYCVLIISFLTLFDFNWFASSPFFVLLVAIAVYGGKKSYEQCYQLKFSDAGDVELLLASGEVMRAKVTASSFYNSFFLSLHLQSKEPMAGGQCAALKKKARRVVIYRDAVSTKEYRQLARLLHFGR
ncbi:protein YgfX [Psychromonas sp. MME2]|uniref:protein YgfX n=1 Tax=unclassified Psychromonas TaxID=2614957 RepID=UPI00339C7EFF